MLAQAWLDAARAINHMIEVYGAGHSPRYAAIDSVSYDVKSPSFLLLMKTVEAVIQDGTAALELNPRLWCRARERTA